MGTAYLASISSSEWRKAVVLSLDPSFIPRWWLNSPLIKCGPLTNEAGSCSTQER